MTRIAYFDCFSGVSGDMILAALLDAGLDFEDWESELQKLRLKGYHIRKDKILKNHIASTKIEIIDQQERTFKNLNDLVRLIEEADYKLDVKTVSKTILCKIAEAESKIHHCPLDKIHFHEIGAIDTIIDVVGVPIALNLLKIKKVYCSKLNVGSGFVEMEHGHYPVPAPATLEILKGIPIYSSDIKAELVTPTGAAVMSTIAEQFCDLPEMEVQTIGYGAGKRNLKHPNVVRVMLGNIREHPLLEEDFISVISTHIDDMNPEFYEHVMEKLLNAGALDVTLSPIFMKKNRPGTKLSVLCDSEKEKNLVKLIFKETSSIGMRIRKERRKKLKRETIKKETKFGMITFKISKMDDELINIQPEYEDCKRLANQNNLPLKQIYAEASRIDPL